MLVLETVPADNRRCGHVVTRATFVGRRLMAFQTDHVSQSARVVLMLLVNVDKAVPVGVISERGPGGHVATTWLLDYLVDVTTRVMVLDKLNTRDGLRHGQRLFHQDVRLLLKKLLLKESLLLVCRSAYRR